jgi:hypothetical protein
MEGKVGCRLSEVVSGGSRWVMTVHAKVVSSIIILKIHPCNNAKYINGT